MKLPNADKVIISKSKLTEYILSETHHRGKNKAKFFRRCGFNETNISIFMKTLRHIASSEKIKLTLTNIYGVKYVVVGKIKCPNGKIVNIKTIWIIEPTQKKPRFITAYPL